MVTATVLRDGQRIEAILKLETAAISPGGRRIGSAVRTLQSKSGPRPPAAKQDAPANEQPRRRPPALGSGETTLLILTGFFTVWFCFVLGFFVAFRRPADILAWEMLGLLLGFGQMAAGETASMHAWGMAWSLPAAAYIGFVSTAWPAFLLWLSDFHDPSA
jgi:hypothetical protein